MASIQVLPYPASGPGGQSSSLSKSAQEPEEPDYAWVPGLIDAATVESLEKIGSQWGTLTGLPFGAPIPLLLLTGLCTVIHRYNPTLTGFPIGVSFGWYILQADEDFEEEEYSKSIQGDGGGGGGGGGVKKGARRAPAGGSSVGTIGWASESEISASEDEFAPPRRDERDPDIFDSLRASLAVQLQQKQKFQEEQVKLQQQKEVQQQSEDGDPTSRAATIPKKATQSDTDEKISGDEGRLGDKSKVLAKSSQDYDSDGFEHGNLSAFHRAAATAAGMRPPPSAAQLAAAVTSEVSQIKGAQGILKKVMAHGPSGASAAGSGVAAPGSGVAAPGSCVAAPGSGVAAPRSGVAASRSGIAAAGSGAAAAGVAPAAVSARGTVAAAAAEVKKKPSGWAKLWRLYDAPPSGQDVKLNWQANGLFAEAISDALSSISMSTVTEDEDADQLLTMHVEMDNLPLRSGAPGQQQQLQGSTRGTPSRSQSFIAGQALQITGSAEKPQEGEGADTSPAMPLRSLSRQGSFQDGVPKPRRGLPKDATLLEILAHVGAKLFETVGSADDNRSGLGGKRTGSSKYGSGRFNAPGSRVGSMFSGGMDDGRSGRSAASDGC